MSVTPPRGSSVPTLAQKLESVLNRAAAHHADPPQGRDAKGRFTKDNPGATGNPFARHVAKLRSVLIHTVREQDMKRIAQDLVVQAKFGNMNALKLLFLYVLGKPPQTVNPDTLDIEEWRQLMQPLAQITQELPEAIMTVPAATASGMVRAAQPYAQRMAAREMKAPPPQACQEAKTEEARRQEDPARPEKKEAGASPRPSPNGVLRPRGAVPKWLDQIAAHARMASIRRTKQRPKGG